MQKVIICQGIPASGKSHWAKEFVQKNSNYIRVNRDDLRNMRGNYWIPKQEDLITDWQRHIIATALNNGLNIVSDDTNLNPKHLNSLVQMINNLAVSLNKTFEIEYKSFLDVPLKKCIERDLQRPNSVGEKVIRNFYYKYVLNINKYEPNQELVHCIIVDLDGTLALFGDKNPYDRNFINDEVNKNVRWIVNQYADTNVHDVIIFSGRSNKYLNETYNWLFKNNIRFTSLYMRDKEDTRPDYEVKKEMFDKYIRDHYKVDFVLDDRPQVVELWRSMGLFVMDCNQSGLIF